MLGRDDRGELVGALMRAARGSGTGPSCARPATSTATSRTPRTAAPTAASTSSADRERDLLGDRARSRDRTRRRCRCGRTVDGLPSIQWDEPELASPCSPAAPSRQPRSLAASAVQCRSHGDGRDRRARRSPTRSSATRPRRGSITPGGRFSKDVPGIRELARGAGGARSTGRHLGPAELRRRPTCASPARRSRRCKPTSSPGCCARSTCRPRSSSAARAAPVYRCSPPRATPTSPRRLAMVVDLGRDLRVDAARSSLLRRVDPRRVARRHGSGRRAARVGGGARTQPAQPRPIPWARTAGIHRDARTMDARVLPRRRAHRYPDCSTPTSRNCRRRRSCSEAARAMRTTLVLRRSICTS